MYKDRWKAPASKIKPRLKVKEKKKENKQTLVRIVRNKYCDFVHCTKIIGKVIGSNK